MKHLKSMLLKKWSLGCAVFLAAMLGATVASAQELACGESDTYLPLGYRWALDPNNAIPVLIHEAGSADFPFEAAEAVLEDVLDTWSEVDCSGSSSSMALALAGTTDVRGPGDQPNAGSYPNIVYWAEESSDWPGDSTTLALTGTLSFGSNGQVATADIVMNGVHFAWRAKQGGQNLGCSAGGSQCFDAYSVLLHEVGHFVGFGHVLCSEAVMTPGGTPDNEFSDLSSHEKAGVCAIYPPRPTPPLRGGSAVPSAFGDACVSSSQCPDGHECLIATEVSQGELRGFCALSCTASSECPAGHLCEIESSGSGNCLPRVEGSLDGSVGGSGEICATCVSGSECEGGFCVSSGEDNDSICTRSCLPDSEFDCPLGFGCAALEEGGHVCFPNDGPTCTTPDFAGINQSCFEDEEFIASCDRDLVCYGYNSVGASTLGACVRGCNGFSSGNICPEGLTCCFGADENGGCSQTPASDGNGSGGCFQLGIEGSTCTLPEQALCASNHLCASFGSNRDGQCYRRCSGNTGCEEGSRCRSFADGAIELCCDASKYDPLDSSTCLPLESDIRDLGVACDENDQCASGVCRTVAQSDEQKFCSRSCSGETQSGCPAPFDSNGDGTSDLIFACVEEPGTQTHWCKPTSGILPGPPEPEEEGGGCSAMGQPGGGYGWLGFIGFWICWMRRRHGLRSARQALAPQR